MSKSTQTRKTHTPTRLPSHQIDLENKNRSSADTRPSLTGPSSIKMPTSPFLLFISQSSLISPLKSKASKKKKIKTRKIVEKRRIVESYKNSDIVRSRMSTEIGSVLSEMDFSGCLKTDLTLGLPGGGGAAEPPSKSGSKRGFSEIVDLKLGANCDSDEVSVSTPPPPK